MGWVSVPISYRRFLFFHSSIVEMDGGVGWGRKCGERRGGWRMGLHVILMPFLDVLFFCRQILRILWMPGPQKTLSRLGGMPLSLTPLEIHILYCSTVRQSLRNQSPGRSVSSNLTPGTRIPISSRITLAVKSDVFPHLSQPPQTLFDHIGAF